VAWLRPDPGKKKIMVGGKLSSISILDFVDRSHWLGGFDPTTLSAETA